ncbi:MAG: hypothetical protein COV29_04120 [Candidatus Yanofskybacteria bacterium CG10_big_fil_rev_8_21_14_0_10_36_16]|uniref:Uncharacterized protein n=1 Tax=Candidatus Yanofskybacteria bacterium CG10_big_fil_rev_8_21_14_0_10_36_16 TaxID=1975096 RepID=A0A2J0QAD6_9BACT|nr:MAG: hypothetical protein COV29_04120 [Candidatus Yanofskybacteria bacterium CG10_big_fil_rev_8_21_14_0_10_36_16]
MKKRPKSLCFIMLLYLCFGQISFGQYLNKGDPSSKTEYLNYDQKKEFFEVYFCVQYYLRPFIPREKSLTLVDQMGTLKSLISCLDDFVKDNPKSNFIAEVELMMAGFHRQLGIEDKFDQQSPYYSPSLYDKNWEKKTKKYLKNVIKNYPRDKYFVFVEPRQKDGLIYNNPHQTSEMTAAAALYYMGTWFDKDDPLWLIIKQYPTSRYAKYAVEKLKERRER